MRPEIKIKDRVRFRTDGDIGELNKINGCLLKNTHIVTDRYNNMIVLDGYMETREILFEICNDFSDVQVGDEIEFSNSLKDKVVASGKYAFTTAKMDKYFMKCNGHCCIRGVFPNVLRVLRITKKADKPLLADAKAGDLCKRRDGKWTSIYDIRKLKFPTELRFYFDDMRGTTGIRGNYYYTATSVCDIIEHQPLAPEGSAEWAWQMWCLLGKEITHERFREIAILPDTPTEKIVIFAGMSAYWANHKEEWLTRCAEMRIVTGWQIYNPEPEKPKCKACNGNGEVAAKPMSPTANNYDVCRHCNGTGYEPEKPKFEVGRYYKKGIRYYRHEGFCGETPKFYCIDLNCVFLEDFTEEYEPIKANDVVLNIGNGIKGRIRKSPHRHNYISVLGKRSGIHIDLASISISIIDEPMKSTVLALLERQKKEENNEKL